MRVDVRPTGVFCASSTGATPLDFFLQRQPHRSMERDAHLLNERSTAVDDPHVMTLTLGGTTTPDAGGRECFIARHCPPEAPAGRPSEEVVRQRGGREGEFDF